MKCERKATHPRSFFFSAALMAAAALAAGTTAYGQAEPAKSSSKPNVVVLLSDQFRNSSWGKMLDQPSGDPKGELFIQTPNLDRIADGGTYLLNAISPPAITMPYHAIFFSGCYPFATGIFNNNSSVIPTNRLDNGKPIVPLGVPFREAGYTMAYSGKMAAALREPQDGDNGRSGFTNFWLNDGQYADWELPEHKADKRGEADREYDRALGWLKQEARADQPFFLMVSVNPPHNVIPHPPASNGDTHWYPAPARFMELFGTYDAEKDKWFAKPGLKQRPTVANFDFENFHIGVEEFERHLAGYYSMIADVDWNVGRILDALDELGVSENTIVIFTGDHGDQLGAQGMRLKQTPYDESANPPFIVRWPAAIQPTGKPMDLLLGAADIMPTLLGLCGLPIPDSVDGRDLSAFLLGKGDPAVEPASVFMVRGLENGPNDGKPRWRAVVTKQYTYALGNDWEEWLLFDNLADPFQQNNLINNPEYAEAKAKLRAETETWMKRFNDPYPAQPPQPERPARDGAAQGERGQRPSRGTTQNAAPSGI